VILSAARPPAPWIEAGSKKPHAMTRLRVWCGAVPASEDDAARIVQKLDHGMSIQAIPTHSNSRFSSARS
jgi:hypothetical protein